MRSTSSLELTRPNAINGSSNSSIPIAPEPSLSKEEKYFLNSVISESLKSILS